MSLCKTDLLKKCLIQFIHVISQVSVNSGGKHCLCLSADGEVYSWGEGDDGKLGHGSKTGADRPRVVEALRGRDVVAISCGGAHSAAVTAAGNENECSLSSKLPRSTKS